MIIAIEGMDGVGKTTQVDRLVHRINMNTGVEAYAMPKDFKNEAYVSCADMVANLLDDGFKNLNPKAVASMFTLQRWEYFHNAGTWSDMHDLTASDEIYVFDRYVGSNKAYQCARVPDSERDYIRSWIDNHEHFDMEIPPADLTIFLYADFNVVLESLKKKADSPTRLDVFEANKEYLKRVYFEYLYLAKDEDWVTIDCSPKAELLCESYITDEIWAKVKGFLKKKGVEV